MLAENFRGFLRHRPPRLSLEGSGATVEVVAVYDTVPAAALACPAAEIEAADYVTFTSSSTVRHLVALIRVVRAHGGHDDAVGQLKAADPAGRA